MKNILFPLAVILSVFFTACDERPEDKETTPPASSEVQPSAQESFASPSVSSLVKTDTGVFRGVTFGMPVEQVRLLEDTINPEEETEAYLDYIVSYNFPETAEVIYYLNNDSLVSSIEAVVFPESKESQKKVYDELLTYYNNRYGDYTLKGDTVHYESRLDNLTLLISKTENKKVHDIILKFKPMGEQAKQ